MACCENCDTDAGACCQDKPHRSVLPVQQADEDEGEEPIIWGPVSAEIPSRDNRLIRQDTIEERFDQILRRGRFTAGHDDTIVGEIQEKVEPDPERVPPADVINPLLPDDATREDVVAMIEEQVEKNDGLVTGFVEVTENIATVYERLEPLVGEALPFAGGNLYLDDRVGEQTTHEVFEGELDGFSISGVSFGSRPIQYCDDSGCQILQDVSDADWHAITLAPSTESKDSAVAGDAVTMNPAATFLPIQQARDDDDEGGLPSLDTRDLLGLIAMGDPFLLEQEGVFYEVHPSREEEAGEGVVHGSYQVEVRPARVLRQDGDLVQQPPELERRKDAILEDNPGMSESTAYAIAQDQLNDEESQSAYTSSTPGLSNPTYGDDDEDEDEEEAVQQATDEMDGDVDPIETVDDMVAHLVEDDGFRPDLEDESEREQAARAIALQLAAEMMHQAKVPDNAVSIDSESEAPEGARTLTGPQGGLYYVPSGDDDRDDESDGADDESDSETFDESWSQQDLPEDMDPTNADTVKTLDEMGAQDGVNAANMRVAEMEDGSRLFVKQDTDTSLASPEQAALGAQVHEELGVPTPRHAYNPDSDSVAVEEVEGQTLAENPETVDRDSLLDAYAASVVSGNFDLHGGNVMVQDDGTAAVIDHDQAGLRLGAEDGEALEAGLNDAVASADQVGVDLTEEDIIERAEEMADELRGDAEGFDVFSTVEDRFDQFDDRDIEGIGLSGPIGVAENVEILVSEEESVL